MTGLQKIWSYLASQHVISITAHTSGEAWSANLFYAVDQAHEALYVMTSQQSRHGKILMENPFISGTVADQTTDVMQLKGIQFKAEIMLVDKDEGAEARKLYILNFPIAEVLQESIWKISFLELKLTDNTAGFGTKYSWLRQK